MGKVMSTIKNPLRNFNVESRAHKVISQPKPKPAPKHKADEISLDRLMKEYPDVYQESLKKHANLDKHLKDVYVISQHENPKVPENPERPLPQYRGAVEPGEFGFTEPTRVPLGKITLRNALQFITNHQADPQSVTAKTIATEHSLSEETVKNVLKYFRVLEMYIPEVRNPKAKFAGPGKPTISIIKEIRKEIGPGPEKKDS